MKTKTMKIVSAILVALMLVLVATTVFAAPTGKDFTDPDSIVAVDDSGMAAKVQTIAGNILSVVQVVGVATAVIMLIVLAIKYISSAPEDKAQIKSHAIVYVVGAICLFAASGILQLIKNVANMF